MDVAVLAAIEAAKQGSDFTANVPLNDEDAFALAQKFMRPRVSSPVMTRNVATAIEAGAEAGAAAAGAGVEVVAVERSKTGSGKLCQSWHAK